MKMAGGAGLILPAEELDRFRSRFVKLSEAAQSLGTSPGAASARLAADGIEPALPRAEYHTPF
jgi:hypothetical protein